MLTIIGTVALATIAFAAANITDLFVLLLFFSSGKFRPQEIVAGQYLGVGALIVLCLLASVFAIAVIPAEWIRLLGIVPVLVGLKAFVDLRSAISEDPSKELSKKAFGANVLVVASVAFADCSDNFAVFIPLLVHNTAAQKAITTITFLVLIGVWCATAHYLVHHRSLGHHIRRYGRLIAPFALTALGVAILVG
jgi:cadmium resistance protein CadD (predicted permease)